MRVLNDPAEKAKGWKRRVTCGCGADLELDTGDLDYAAPEYARADRPNESDRYAYQAMWSCPYCNLRHSIEVPQGVSMFLARRDARKISEQESEP